MLGLFRELTDEQERNFRAWARENYTPGGMIQPVWHPAVRAECEQMNLETLQKKEC